MQSSRNSSSNELPAAVAVTAALAWQLAAPAAVPIENVVRARGDKVRRYVAI
jgi:hypothetical protein